MHTRNDKLKILYRNTDQFPNKHEYLLMIADDQPDIILMTEVIPKAQIAPLPITILTIQGYSSLFNFDPNLPNVGSSSTRGITIYVSGKLEAKDFEIIDSDFHEQLWIKLMLRGCIYRSPSGNQMESTLKLCDMFKAVMDMNPFHLIISGDFNYKEIDWSGYYSTAGIGHHSYKFLETVPDCYLVQHKNKLTRYRIDNSPNLDLLFSSENNNILINDLLYLLGIGQSDHKLYLMFHQVLQN